MPFTLVGPARLVLGDMAVKHRNIENIYSKIYLFRIQTVYCIESGFEHEFGNINLASYYSRYRTTH